MGRCDVSGFVVALAAVVVLGVSACTPEQQVESAGNTRSHDHGMVQGVPLVVGLQSDEARRLIKREGYRVRIEGRGLVTRQDPSPDMKVPKNVIVHLTAE